MLHFIVLHAKVLFKLLREIVIKFKHDKQFNGYIKPAA